MAFIHDTLSQPRVTPERVSGKLSSSKMEIICLNYAQVQQIRAQHEKAACILIKK